jgi:hypothetical protein
VGDEYIATSELFSRKNSRQRFREEECPTSCAPESASTEQLLRWTRPYCAIENGSHYRRDVTLREDATRISQPALAKTIAALNNLLIGLCQKLGYANLASARCIFNAQIAAQLPA